MTTAPPKESKSLGGAFTMIGPLDVAADPVNVMMAAIAAPGDKPAAATVTVDKPSAAVAATTVQSEPQIKWVDPRSEPQIKWGEHISAKCDKIADLLANQDEYDDGEDEAVKLLEALKKDIDAKHQKLQELIKGERGGCDYASVVFSLLALAAVMLIGFGGLVGEMRAGRDHGVDRVHASTAAVLAETTQLLAQVRADKAELITQLKAVAVKMNALHDAWDTEFGDGYFPWTTDQTRQSNKQDGLDFFSDTMPAGHALVSANKQFSAVMQKDCNLVIYKSDQWTAANAVWSTRTDNRITWIDRVCQLQIDHGWVKVVDKTVKEMPQTLWSRQCFTNGKRPGAFATWKVSNDTGRLIVVDEAAVVCTVE